MKSFFKKLSLVLAAAMIITLIPAQAAKAEGTIKVALQDAKSSADTVENYTLKVGATEDFKFYGCVDYKTTGTGWVSSNEAVATVDNAGVVTAVAAGYTEVAYTAKGYTSVPVKIVVADEYDVNIAEQDSKTVATSWTFTKIGDSQDFCFVGAKGYSLAANKCTWTSTNTAVATVDKVGVVTAVAEGTCQIILTIVDKASGAVAFAVAPLDVTVAEAKLEATQVSYNTAKVTYDDAAPGEVTVWAEIDGIRVQEYVTTSDTTVTFYNGITNGVKYTVVDANGNEAEFTGNVGTVADFTVKYYSTLNGTKTYDTAYAGLGAQVVVSNPVDANGIGVKGTGYTVRFTDVQYVDGTNDINSVNYDGFVYVSAAGEKHTVTVELVDDTTGNVLVSKTVEITGVAVPTVKIDANTVALKLGTIGTAYSNCGTDFRLSTDDGATYALALYAKDTVNNAYTFDAGEVFTGNVEDGADEDEVLRDLGQFVFESSNYDVLGVTDEGVLEARNVGSATIFVYFEYVDDDTSATQKVLLKTASFQVVGALVPTTVTLASTTTNMYASGNYARIADKEGACDFNWVTFTYTVKDQLGRTLALEPTVTASNNDDDFITVETGIRSVFVEANDVYDADDSKTYTSILTIKFTNNGTTVTRTASVVVFNTDAITASNIPGVVLCGVDTATGIGNTDNYAAAADEQIRIGVHIVDVYPVGSAYVYGDDVENNILNYSVIKNVTSSADLAALEANNAGAYYAAVYINGTLTDITAAATTDAVTLVDNDHGTNGGQYLSILIRDAFNDLTDDDLNDDGNVDALDYAIALSKLTSTIVKVDVYDLYNTNTMESTQVTATWKKGICSKYDTVVAETYKNNDVANYAAAITINDLTYEGDIPATEDQWADWFADHTDLVANYWAYDDGDGVDASGVAYNYINIDETYAVTFDEDDHNYDLVDFAISTMTQNSKYIQSAGLFFELDGSGDTPDDGTMIITYIPVSIGKKITQYNYQYKGENDIEDGEGNN